MSMDSRSWSGMTRGGALGQGFLIWLFSVIRPSWFYWILYIIIPFYMIFNREAVRVMYRYFRDQWNCPPLKSCVKIFRNHILFGKCMFDKFGFYGRNGSVFDVEFEGELDLQDGQGVLVVTSHIGNFELAGLFLGRVFSGMDGLIARQVRKKRKVAVMTYGGESKTIQEFRSKAFNLLGVTVLHSDSDMRHLFIARDYLLKGSALCVTCDRFDGRSKTQRCQFLSGDVDFPINTFALAVHTEVPVLAVFCMRDRKSRYKIYFKCFPSENHDNETRDQMIRHLAQSYLNYEQKVLEKYPEQWFNFYDFWRKS